MIMNNDQQLHFNIVYSCTDVQMRGREQFVPEHTLSWLITGEIEFHTNYGTLRAPAGSIGFVKRNELVKALKIPSPQGHPCQSISIQLEQPTLQRYSSEHNRKARTPYQGAAILQVSDKFIRGYFDSLLPYFDSQQQMTKALFRLKTDEAIELLLQYDPTLEDLLFDFSEPHKIDLEAYMNQHFKFNVSLKQFAKLTGRSLATFKRDFQKIFGTAPQRWLLTKRLQEAHFLIAERRQKPSDAYVEAGFENLSHFSFSFKQFFGYNPSSISHRYAK